MTTHKVYKAVYWGGKSIIPIFTPDQYTLWFQVYLDPDDTEAIYMLPLVELYCGSYNWKMNDPEAPRFTHSLRVLGNGDIENHEDEIGKECLVVVATCDVSHISTVELVLSNDCEHLLHQTVNGDFSSRVTDYLWKELE